MVVFKWHPKSSSKPLQNADFLWTLVVVPMVKPKEPHFQTSKLHRNQPHTSYQ